MASAAAAAASLQQGPDPAVMDAINRGNAVVFLDVVLGGGKEDLSGGNPLGRIKLELFVKDVSDEWRRSCNMLMYRYRIKFFSSPSIIFFFSLHLLLQHDFSHCASSTIRRAVSQNMRKLPTILHRGVHLLAIQSTADGIQGLNLPSSNQGFCKL